MSTEATLPISSNRRSYRCYNCNEAFHITTITTTNTNTSAVSSSFRCPRCFHRHLLPNYTIVASVTPPSEPSTVNFTPPITDSFTVYSSDSDADSDWTDYEDLSFEVFNSTQFRSPTLNSFLHSLPIVKINEPSKSCPICMDEFEIDSEASQLPCKHFFHKDCIVPWLNRSNTCPLCRHKLPQEEEDETEKNLEHFLNSTGSIGEIGDGEFQDNSFVVVSTAPARRVTSLGLRGEFGEDDDDDDDDDDDLRERDLEEMRDEDGDVLMVDA